MYMKKRLQNVSGTEKKHISILNIGVFFCSAKETIFELQNKHVKQQNM